MIAFFDLFVNHSSRPEFRDDPAWADSQFPAVVAASPLRLWKPGDPIATQGNRYLIGVASWCGYDMRLLDDLVEIVKAKPNNPHLIEVFNTADCPHQEDFNQYISGIAPVLHTPVVGFWRDGQLVWSGQGHNARELLAGAFGLCSAEIIAFVQDWIKARAHA